MDRSADNHPAGITMRLAGPGDAAALRRLAALDSATALAGEVLLAEADDALLAAIALEGGRSIADPFQHTSAAVEMLELRAAQLRDHAVPPAGPGISGRMRAAAAAFSPRTH